MAGAGLGGLGLWAGAGLGGLDLWAGGAGVVGWGWVLG